MFWSPGGHKLADPAHHLLYIPFSPDMETGYKVFRREVIDGMVIRARRFNFEPEFTAKILKPSIAFMKCAHFLNPRVIRRAKRSS